MKKMHVINIFKFQIGGNWKLGMYCMYVCMSYVGYSKIKNRNEVIIFLANATLCAERVCVVVILFYPRVVDLL